MQRWVSQNIGKELNKQVTPKLVWLIKWSKAGSLSWPGQDKIIKKWVNVLQCWAESKSQPQTHGRCWELQRNIYKSLLQMTLKWMIFLRKIQITKIKPGSSSVKTAHAQTARFWPVWETSPSKQRQAQMASLWILSASTEQKLQCYLNGSQVEAKGSLPNDFSKANVAFLPEP